ncbi:MAG: TrkA C-terminal domain-containing protein [Verrucomicrobiae bacterium]|nr:TrkA C-terminal domain-containing protein [Verrucomicrobiae bacterium]
MTELIGHFLKASPLMALFLVIGVGYLGGVIRFPGEFRLGTVAVLFVGLAFGAMYPWLTLPAEIMQIGLVLFVYGMGLEAGPGFFRCLRHEGLRYNVIVAFVLTFVFGVCWLLILWGGMPASLVAGMYCGSLTHTPSLGGVTETYLVLGEQSQADQAVAGYGITYPVAIVTALFFYQIASWIKTRAGYVPVPPYVPQPPRTIEVLTEREPGMRWTVARIEKDFGIVVTRCLMPDGRMLIAHPEMQLPVKTWVVVVGAHEKLEQAAGKLGIFAPVSLETSLIGFEVHRYLISNHALAGRPISGLDLEKLGAVISRVRRGDVDLPVSESLVLYLGDQVRVVCYKDNEPEVRAFFGNSLQIQTEGGYLSFGLGIVLGILLGLVPFPVPGLSTPVRMGLAGGVLLVGLVLGALGRTGGIVWQIPPTVNLTLRQLGLLLFFAGVGLGAGRTIVPTLQAQGPMLIFLAVVLCVGGYALIWGLLILCREGDLSRFFGTASGYQTQPATLEFGSARADRSAVVQAYAMVFPLASILKIVLSGLLIR